MHFSYYGNLQKDFVLNMTLHHSVSELRGHLILLRQPICLSGDISYQAMSKQPFKAP